MSNEELVAAIQGGEHEKLEELWNQVAGLVKWRAGRTMAALERYGSLRGMEYEDLCQCGYPALVAAVNSYKPESGAFSTWLMYHIRNAFAEACGYRSEKQDPLHDALSLDKPLSDQENGALFGDLIPDRKAAEEMDCVLEDEFRRELHTALELALSSLPGEMAQVLRLRNYHSLTLEEIGDRTGMAREEVRKLEKKAIRKLREPQISSGLRGFYEFDFYSGAGLTAYRRSGLSIEEKYILAKEREMSRRLHKGNCGGK